MFNPQSHPDLFEKARKKKYGIVFITDTDTTVYSPVPGIPIAGHSP